MSFTVNVPVGYSVVVSSDANSNGTYQQVGDSVVHSPTFMGVNSTVVLGPYAATISFEIASKAGNLDYALTNSSQALSAMMAALVASTSP